MEKTLNKIKETLFRAEIGILIANQNNIISDIRKVRSLCQELTRKVNKHFNTVNHMVGVGKVLRQE